jgi:GGDEF domain-containing protein
VSASIGVAMLCDHDNADELLQAADRGMYEAKRAGRGRYRHGVAAISSEDGSLG